MVQVAVLGPLAVTIDGRSVAVTGGRLRALLVMLALDAPRPSPVQSLIDALWPEDPPSDPANALQSLVSRLRRALGDPGLITQGPAGYRLAMSSGDLDANRWVEGARTAHQLLAERHWSQAAGAAAEALQLWRGAPLADVDLSVSLGAPIARWEELRLESIEDRAEALIHCGQADQVIPELDEVVATHPLRARPVELLLTALASNGRSAEALAAYERHRRFLADELGTDPAPELQQLHLTLLRGEFEAEQGADTRGPHSTTLPAWLTSFVGREPDLDQLAVLISHHRLSTVVGPGGAGKTRLATEAARRWQQKTGERVWLVELAPIDQSTDIAGAILGALGLRDVQVLDRNERAVLDTRQRLLDALREAAALLVLDNCEHLIEPVAELASELLKNAPTLKILATSREPLGMIGEAISALGPLALPAEQAGLDEALNTASVNLFLDRATAVNPGFVLDPVVIPDVIEIVRRLDGLPLAIELAAARVRVLPVPEIAARLSDRFRLLTGGNRASLPQHRTLRAVVEWSWDLLQPDERLLAERLSVFPSGTTADRAAAICADDQLPAELIGDCLLSLADKSLLHTVEGTQLRFRMLETIREFGVERLSERGEIARARSAHARHFAELAIDSEPCLRSADQIDALRTLNAERENIMAGLRYLGDSGETELALRVCLALYWYWTLTQTTSECLLWAEFVIDAFGDTDHPHLPYARALRALARLQTSMSDPVDWEAEQAEMLLIDQQLAHAPEPWYVSLASLRPILGFLSNNEAKPALLPEDQPTDPWIRAALHVARASIAENDGNLEEMRSYGQLSYSEFAVLGDRWGMAAALGVRGQVAALEGDLAGAIADYSEALRYTEELGSAQDDLYLNIRLAELRRRQGDTGAARRHLERLTIASDDRPESIFSRAMADAGLAFLLSRNGDQVEANRLAESLRSTLISFGPWNPRNGHLSAIILSITAFVAIQAGDLQQAFTDLSQAYPAALGSRDMPIAANLGDVVAACAIHNGQLREGAVLIGVAARIRGALDRSDDTIQETISKLREQLGKEFDSAFAEGMALDRDEALARIDPQLAISRS